MPDAFRGLLSAGPDTTFGGWIEHLVQDLPREGAEESVMTRRLMVLSSLIIFAVGCALVAEVDRNKIPSGAAGPAGVSGAPVAGAGNPTAGGGTAGGEAGGGGTAAAGAAGSGG